MRIFTITKETLIAWDACEASVKRLVELGGKLVLTDDQETNFWRLYDAGVEIEDFVHLIICNSMMEAVLDGIGGDRWHDLTPWAWREFHAHYSYSEDGLFFLAGVLADQVGRLCAAGRC